MASSGGGSGPGKRDQFLMKGINEQKLKSFSIGSMGRRGPTRKEQEEMRKKKADEEEVGKVYAEFVSSFQSGAGGGGAGSGSGSKTWIKAGTFNAGNRSEDSTGKGQIYSPVSRIQSRNADPLPPKTDSTANRRPERPGSKKKEKEKKKSNLEAFKEELKARQEERLERHRIKNVIKGPGFGSGSVDGSRDHLKEDKEDIMKPFLSDPASGSHDNGDPNTTNVYLGNLSPKLTEQELMELFGKYGPLASIKIMWPRTEDEKARGRNCGFVAYMARKDAERAMRYLLGKMIDGFEMKMGWGKPVPLPLHPVYVPPSMLKLTMPPEPTGLPFNCQPASELDRAKAKSLESGDAFSRLLRRGTVRVTIPSDRTQLCLINRMAEFVIREGPMFEAMIMNREINNRLFQFLFENQSPEHIYYRWRLFSLLQGDSKEDWRTDEFRMFKGGSLWKPPTISIFTQGMPDDLVVKDMPKEEITQKKETKKKKSLPGGLSDSQRDRFEGMLRNLLPDRNPVAETMVWCIEHAEAGEEIVDCISESLSIDKTPLAKKIARLYLISDILHNCSVKGVPNVSYYRKGFQTKLPEIFSSLNVCFKSIEGRIRAESFRQRVLGCFRAWEDWALYPQDFLIRLQNIFLGLVNDKNGGNSDDSDTKEDVGNSEEEDVDGIPLDGAALLKKARKSVGADPVLRTTATAKPSGFAPSRWETVDQKTVQAQAVTSKWELFDQNDEKKRKSDEEDDDDDIDGVPLDEGSGRQLSLGLSEDRRAKLREIEVKVMCFQDELESGKVSSKPGWTISEQVEQYRRMLINSDRRGEVDGRGRRRTNSSSSSSSGSSCGNGQERRKRRKKRDDSSGSDSSDRYSRSSRTSHKKRKR